ncbi:MAG TPA: Ig-like domain-containing protein, partial [Flavisolibacter sp.]|nr:Ig-like domain-containing protein [Flavisolibacter sp.]
MNKLITIYVIIIVFISCSKGGNSNPSPTPAPPATTFSFNSLKVNGSYNGYTYYNINPTPVIKFSFTEPLNHTSATNSISFKDNSGIAVAFNSSYENGDSTFVIQPSSPLQFL